MQSLYYYRQILLFLHRQGLEIPYSLPSPGGNTQMLTNEKLFYFRLVQIFQNM